MSYESLLISTCTIQRYAEGARDAYGKPAPTWTDVPALTDIPCRLIEGIGKGTLLAGREVRVGAEVVVADYTLFLLDVEITEQDRVVIGAVTYQVRMVIRPLDSTGGHHKEIALETVR